MDGTGNQAPSLWCCQKPYPQGHVLPHSQPSFIHSFILPTTSISNLLPQSSLKIQTYLDASANWERHTVTWRLVVPKTDLNISQHISFMHSLRSAIPAAAAAVLHYLISHHTTQHFISPKQSHIPIKQAMHLIQDAPSTWHWHCRKSITL